MKTILEMVEKTILVAMLSSSCMGFTLIGWFLLKLVLTEVTTKQLWVVFLISLVLTCVLNQLLVVVSQELIYLDLDEMAFQQDEEARTLYEHLKVQ